MPTIGLLGDHRVDEIPASHLDLLAMTSSACPQGS